MTRTVVLKAFEWRHVIFVCFLFVLGANLIMPAGLLLLCLLDKKMCLHQGPTMSAVNPVIFFFFNSLQFLSHHRCHPHHSFHPNIVACAYFQDDLQPFIRELLQYHPGLEFLDAHPDFHPKYATTVTTRIFYIVNTR